MPPRPPPHHHAQAPAVNPDASSFAARANDEPAPHAPGDRDGWPGSADRWHAGRASGPPVHSRRRNRSDRGCSSCKSAPASDSGHTRTAEPALARCHMDEVCLPEIMPRHACVARCGARRRSGLGGFGRRRACHPAGGHRAIVRAIQRATSATHADLWIYGTTQERCPIYPQDQKTKSKCLFDCLESGGTHTQPVGSHTRPLTATTRHQTAAPSLRGFRQPFTKLRRRAAAPV